MFGFIFGILVGFGVKMAYDFFQEERIPTDLGMAQGRAEAIMDETRQIVREIREELRTAATAAQTSAAKKSERLQSAATGGSKPKSGNGSGSATRGTRATPASETASTSSATEAS
jgi:hypothetical protein